MKTAYFDCFSGISGDMILGALVDAGCDLALLKAELRRLPMSGWSITAAKVRKGAVAATQLRVETGEHHHHRGLSDILAMIARAGFAVPRVASRATAIFQKLGEAEARVHDVAIEKVHFHEVGAVDSIVDIVGACVGFELLGIEEFVCSALNVGSGSVETAHGRLPVPAPATAELLRGTPVYSTGIARELVTPTGAAVVATLCERFGPMPALTANVVGYGAGSADLAEQPNVLRLFVGESAGREAALGRSESVVVIEANFDDMNPQIYGFFAERAFAAGALDVFATPVQMKKARPGQLLTVLCEPAAEARMVELIFRETTTIGVRVHEARRRVLDRESVAVETPHGTVHIKVARQNGLILNAAPEYEECRRVAEENGIPLKQVLAEAVSAFESGRKKN